jgi:glutamate---cysteine ligase / carboxylate-amine ligase
MSPRKKKNKLLDAAGLEVGYSIVAEETLSPAPIDESFLAALPGFAEGSVLRGDLNWSKGPASHTLLLRTAKPVKAVSALRKKLNTEVRAMNAALAKDGRRLLPSGMHPFMDPARDAVAWSNGHAPQRKGLFDLHQHGVSNSNGLRIGLSFANDDEFAKLHAAVRILLPIIPALTASSPIVNGKRGTGLDMRFVEHMRSCSRYPPIMGPVIPEAVFNQEDYYREIFTPMGKALAAIDSSQVPDHQSTNGRGAIARFDNGFIEIIVADAQECAGADVAIAELIATVMKGLVSGRWMSSYVQRAWHESDLFSIFNETLDRGGDAIITNKEYLQMFGAEEEATTAGMLWHKLANDVKAELSAACIDHVDPILELGCLASRILKRTGDTPDHGTLVAVYDELATCLMEDRPFV